MEINVTKNMLTGESTVLSTAPVPTEELNQHTGLKVYDDGRKCVYALPSQQVSPLLLNNVLLYQSFRYLPLTCPCVLLLLGVT